jgi:hypothetical protein
MWLLMLMQGVSKRALQRYSKCYCVASVTKTFTFEGVQTIHRSTPCLYKLQSYCNVFSWIYNHELWLLWWFASCCVCEYHGNHNPWLHIQLSIIQHLERCIVWPPLSVLLQGLLQGWLYFFTFIHILVVKALDYKPEGRGLESRWGEILSYLILPAALGLGVHSASNRNEYRKH